ncbi:MAG: DUF3313 family protein [Pseudomonadales bacterium]|nr:DUF3313 family protein [Pseudomonadales bacterium]
MRSLILYVALLATTPAYGASPHVDTGPGAETTFDGLYRVERSVADAAWVAPGFDLSRYQKLLVRSAGVSFKPVDWKGGTTAAIRRGETEFPVTERNRQLVANLLQKELLEELAKSKRYELTDASGDDVLLVTAGLFDVVSNVPPETAGRDRTYLRTIGEATLVIEVRDSATGAILARAVDRRAADTHRMQESNPAFNRAEVQRLMDSWGRTIRHTLDTVVRIGDGGALVKGAP